MVFGLILLLPIVVVCVVELCDVRTESYDTSDRSRSFITPYSSTLIPDISDLDMYHSVH
jgi:hypothetical protein